MKKIINKYGKFLELLFEKPKSKRKDMQMIYYEIILNNTLILFFFENSLTSFDK
jgi:hypothetical protein